MEIASLLISDVKCLTPKRYGDERGYFAEVYRRAQFADLVSPLPLVQENEAFSEKLGTLRGLHGQMPPAAQGKLVRVPRGKILDVAVDIRPESPSFGKYCTIILDDAKGQQLWIPPQFLHGYVTLQPNTLVCYMVSAEYAPHHEIGAKWNDADLAIDWPRLDSPFIISKKDEQQPPFAQLRKRLLQDFAAKMGAP